MRPPSLVLLDFDGVLVQYRRDLRIAHLAAAAGVASTRVREALFDSGLEATYDSGDMATADYLQRLGENLGAEIDASTWIAARVAACVADPRVIEQVLALSAHTPIAVLTNNGPLLAEAMPRIVPALFPTLAGRVLCSGALGLRKPDPEIFRRALAHFRMPAQQTLFMDDLFINVQGARSIGMHADTVKDARGLRRVLKRHGAKL